MAGDLTRLSATRAAPRFTADSGHKAGCRGIELDALFRQKRFRRNGGAAYHLQARDLHRVAPAPPAISVASEKPAGARNQRHPLENAIRIPARGDTTTVLFDQESRTSLPLGLAGLAFASSAFTRPAARGASADRA